MLCLLYKIVQLYKICPFSDCRVSTLQASVVSVNRTLDEYPLLTDTKYIILGNFNLFYNLCLSQNSLFFVSFILFSAPCVLIIVIRALCINHLSGSKLCNS